MTYGLQLDEGELNRYRAMSAAASEHEMDDWQLAGVCPGASVADVGCGPGAVLRRLSEAVGRSGQVVGVDRDPEALRLATVEVDDLPNASVVSGSAQDTGLPLGTYDVVMCRHVLAHNASDQAAIVGHLRDLTRPGGAVYLVDADLTSGVLFPEPEPLLVELGERYRRYQSFLGNDGRNGARLGGLLDLAGLYVERFHVPNPAFRLPARVRGPEWTARAAMVAAGFATSEEVRAWEAAFERLDEARYRPWVVLPMYVAIGRKPARDVPIAPTSEGLPA
ncbi:class I SAM-dependent methyltransferase [Kribbella sindirgiensis]|uniref:Class I SAM-dependent methyltransferase n=1 Tax=Kribbella sindirgiensis TaxID=1124744 RepID=A0A4R0IQP6_9ACTN|nr:class I SAM-dependent methyltransferase [Kribbella sindirgiensis]TCC34920.1 class I SAM-dependent methyltransferase [Kribbella sindirgiensis]